MANPNRFYSLETLQKAIPAAFSTEPAPFVSDKYTFVRTADIIESFYKEGWRAVEAQQGNSRKSDPQYAKHTVLLRQMDDEAKHSQLGSLFSAIRLTNSHNHSSRISSMQELLRQVCDNGMVVSEGEFGSFNMRHDRIDEDIQTIMHRFRSQSEKQMQTAVHWNSLTLEPEQVTNFLQQAASLRFGESATEDHQNALNHIRRYDDQPNTLWALFNRVQENGMQGAPKAGQMKRKVRALSNIDSTQDWNIGLRDLAYATVGGM